MICTRARSDTAPDDRAPLITFGCLQSLVELGRSSVNDANIWHGQQVRNAENWLGVRDDFRHWLIRAAHRVVIDHFHLLKIGERWSIVSKLWDAEP